MTARRPATPSANLGSPFDIDNAGARTACVSNWAVNDMVGNLWEWTADWVQGNGTSNAWIPSAGVNSATYGSDSQVGANPAAGAFAIAGQGNGANMPAALIRGGDYTIGTQSGVFALNAVWAPSFKADNVGFRCAM